MPRLRSRLTSKENTDGPAETKKSPKIRGTVGSRVVTTKKKGNDDKLIVVNALATLRSPVLRDRTNLTLEPTKIDLLKKGIEVEAADDAATTKAEMKATRTKQKKDSESKAVKAVTGRARTRGNKGDVEETVNPKQSTSSDTSGMVVTDAKDNVPVKAVRKVTAKSNDNVEKKRPMTKRSRLVEQKPESKVNTRAKTAGVASDKVNLLRKNSDKPEDVEEQLSSNKADDDKSEDSASETADDEPKDVKKKSAKINKPRVSSNKRPSRARKIKEVDKRKDFEEKSSKEAGNDESEESAPETADDEPIDVKKKSAKNTKPSVSSNKRPSRVRKTIEVDNSKDVEEKSSNTDNDKSEDSASETADDKPENVKSKLTGNNKTSVSPNKRSSRIRKTEEADKPTGKKFFKTLVPTAHSKISPMKKPRLGAKSKIAGGRKARGKVASARTNVSFRFRQTTLQESLANLSKKALRPRPPQKNDNGNSSPTKKKVTFKKKGPVYREILNESNTSKKDSPDKIYEFSYDLNDSQERIKKRKKKITRRAPVKRAKAATKPKNTVDKKVKPAVVTTDTKIPEKIVTEQPIAPTNISNESAENNRVSITVAAEVYDPPNPEPFFEDEPMSIGEDPPIVSTRPVVISCQELSGENRINWTTTPVQPKPTEKESLAPRPYSQRPSIQMKTMMDTSLIRRSLSPISKANPVPFIEDSGSPWRLVPSNSFSRVKNVFQSTPQGKKFSTLLGKASAVENKRSSLKMDKIAETNDENSDSQKNSSLENVQTNNSKSPRKFGTEISNINITISNNQEGISPSKSPRKFGTNLSNSNNSASIASPVKKKLSNSSSAMSPVKKLSKSLVVDKNRSSTSRGEKSVTNASTIGKISIQNAPADETLDKENSAPNYQSPSKTPRKISRSLGSSPLKVFPNNKSGQDSTLGSPFKGFPSNKPGQDSILGSPFKGFPSNKPGQDSILGSPFKGFPSNKPCQDSILGSPFKGFLSNKPCQDSILESPFKGFPSESPLTSAVSEVTQELQPDIEPQPEIEPQPDIEPQPGIEPQPNTETQPAFEPQPGPSGLQKSSPPVNTWKLKQSNLNRFLNLPEKPTSSRISTVHGLFDDLYTSPIEGNINKKVTRTEGLNVENAFGFDDNDYESDDANISYDFNEMPKGSFLPEKVPSTNIVKTKTIKAVVHNNNNEPEAKKTARFSIGAINRVLRSNKKDDEIEQADKEVAPATVEYHVATKKNLIEPIKFLDTFDLSSVDVNTEEINEPPGLFLDTEPVVHFDKPPRFSYKRKRRQRLMSCGDTEEESDEEEGKRPKKKKKLTKAQREHNKQLENWAKLINNTFEEIDHYNLVVE